MKMTAFVKNGSFSARTRLAAASPPVSMILAYSLRNPGKLRWRMIGGRLRMEYE
jgi:hypothetical protein